MTASKIRKLTAPQRREVSAAGLAAIRAQERVFILLRTHGAHTAKYKQARKRVRQANKDYALTCQRVAKENEEKPQ